MRNIKSLYLANYRIFSKLSQFDLSPVSILTGINSSGKSSIVKSLNLLKNIDYKSYPYSIRFDKDKNNSLNFGLIKNNSSKEDQIILGYDIYNVFLGHNVDVFLRVENKNDFVGIVRKIQIQVKNETILSFKFEDGDNTIVYANIEFFLNNLKRLITLKEKFLKYEKIIRNDDKIPDSPGAGGGRETGLTLLFDDGTYRKLNEKELQAQVEKDNMLRKEYDQLIEDNPISESEKKWLKYFYDPVCGIEGQFPLESKWYDVFSSFNVDDYLFNHHFIKLLATIPKKELNAANVKAIIKENLPDKGRFVDESAIDESVQDILDTLKIQSYIQKETSIIKKQNELRKIALPDTGFPVDKISSSTHDYGKAIFEEDLFYKIFRHGTLKKTKNQYSKKWSEFNRSPENLRILMNYISIVFKKTEDDLFNDINSIIHVPLSSMSVSRLIDFNHPLHKLIAAHKENLEKNSFVKYWLKEFDVCDNFSIEAPVAGLGYSILLNKGGNQVQLFDEGMGTVHLIAILFNIAVHESEYHFTGSKTIILEEPEANMHPAWQSRLADMFADSTNKMGVHFIIETHSEYLVRKLQNLVATKKVNKENVVIHYIGKKDPKTKNPEIRNIRINHSGTLSQEFGPGFFDEADNLAIDLFNFKKINKN